MHKQWLTIINRTARAFTFLGLIALHMNAAYSQVSEIEREALLALYSATNGEAWENNSGWKDAAVGTECAWYGVACSNNQVFRIRLDGNNLQGTIPAEIANLDRLEGLSLTRNSLTGQVPNQLASLTLLIELRLSQNKLSGELPRGLSDLENLEILNLSDNLLTGILPSWLVNLSSLRVLILKGNQLSGEIPAWLGNMRSLYSLGLGANNFTGSIPEELGDLSNLNSLSLYENNLSGGIPPSLGKLVKLETLYLYSNSLTGSIPKELVNLVKLERLSFAYNDLTGAIPPELGNLTELTFLSLPYNSLSGEIPVEIGNLTKLNTLYLFANSLSGEIPAQLGNLINVNQLSLSQNSLTGSIPAALGNLETLEGLYLYDNSLSGSIPAELGNLVNLTVLDLSSNLLTGTVPEALYSLPKLNSFKISNNAYVPIVELTYESLLEDSDGADGEEVTLTATAEDLDGTISETKWLFEGDVISTELSLTFRLPNGENEVLFIATDDSGRATSKTATIKVKANYEPTTAWPDPYNGVAPQSALSLQLNNIGLYEAKSGAISTCVKIYDGGEPSEFNGVTQYDIIFSVIDEQTGNIQYTNARPFNEIEKLNSDEELPDCSGTYDIDSNIYSDTIETRLLTNLFGVALQIVKTFEVSFEIIDPANLIFQLKSYEELLAP